MDDIYKNIVFGDMIADIFINKKFNPIVTNYLSEIEH